MSVPIVAQAVSAMLLDVTLVTAQSLTGTTGLVTIPTAAMPADGEVSVGLVIADRRYDGYPGADHAALVQFASVGFLPIVEVSVRLTRQLGVPRQALGDRMVSMRLRLLKEGTRIPAVVVGVHDLVGTRRYYANYVVVSKELRTAPVGVVGLHVGYGGEWMNVRARGRQFVGPFGGVSVEPRPRLALLMEYDAAHVNAGVRVRLFGHVTLLGAVQNFDGLSGGVSYTGRL